MKDVKYVPNLRKMLISVGQLDEEGHVVKLGKCKWKFNKENFVTAQGKKKGTIYIVELTS